MESKALTRLSTNTSTKVTTRDTRNYTSIDIETIAKTATTETTWATHVNVIAATIVIQTTATTNDRDEEETNEIRDISESNETTVTTGDPCNNTIAKMNGHVDPLLQDRATILAP